MYLYGSLIFFQGCANLQYSDCECTITGKFHNSARKAANKHDTGESVLAGSIGAIAGLATAIAGYLTLLCCLRKCMDEGISKIRPSRNPLSASHTNPPSHKPIPTNVYQNSGQSGYRNVYRFSNVTYGGTSVPDNIQMSYTDASHDWR